MIDLEAIRRRNALTDKRPIWKTQAELDRQDMLAYVDALREAAGKMACWGCNGQGKVLERGDPSKVIPCPDCADLRRLLSPDTPTR